MGPVKIITVLVVSTLLAQTPAQTLPQFAFTTAGGRKISNADLPSGRLSLFAIVDPDCDHCQRMVSSMNGASSTFNKAAIYMVSLSDPDKLTAFARRFGPRLNARWLLDTRGEFISRFQPIRSPAVFLYSPDKKLLDYEDNPESIFRTANSIDRNAR